MTRVYKKPHYLFPGVGKGVRSPQKYDHPLLHILHVKVALTNTKINVNNSIHGVEKVKQCGIQDLYSSDYL